MGGSHGRLHSSCVTSLVYTSGRYSDAIGSEVQRLANSEDRNTEAGRSPSRQAWSRQKRKVEVLLRKLEETDLNWRKRLELRRVVHFEQQKLKNLEEVLVKREADPGRAFNQRAMSPLIAPGKSSSGQYVAAAPADIELRVRVDGSRDGERLDYELHSPNGSLELYKNEVRGPHLGFVSRAYWQHLAKKIEKLCQGLDFDGSTLLGTEVVEKLDGIGRDLYNYLFPREMRVLYRRFRNATSFQVISDEPWIPWEMIKPFDAEDSADIIDDDFFGARFQITRWLAGGKPPPRRVEVRRATCLDAGQVEEMPSLDYTSREIAMIAEIIGDEVEVESFGVSKATSATMKGVLEGGRSEFLHFAGHGEFQAVVPDESGILMADGKIFRCVDLQGGALLEVSRVRPWVFLNACRGGRQEASLSGIGGWAERWVRQANCGGFGAPQWCVEDRLAYEFARRFYSCLKDGGSFGEAALLARRHVREVAPRSPAWLAFAVYAHPSGRLEFQRGLASEDKTRIFEC